MSFQVSDGRRGGLRRPQERNYAMRKFFLLTALASIAMLVFATAAFAVTVPAVPVDSYGDALLSGLAGAIADIFPYAAAITAFAIGVGMVRRWLGTRKATSV